MARDHQRKHESSFFGAGGSSPIIGDEYGRGDIDPLSVRAGGVARSRMWHPEGGQDAWARDWYSSADQAGDGSGVIAASAAFPVPAPRHRTTAKRRFSQEASHGTADPGSAGGPCRARHLPQCGERLKRSGWPRLLPSSLPWEGFRGIASSFPTTLSRLSFPARCLRRFHVGGDAHIRCGHVQQHSSIAGDLIGRKRALNRPPGVVLTPGHAHNSSVDFPTQHGKWAWRSLKRKKEKRSAVVRGLLGAGRAERPCHYSIWLRSAVIAPIGQDLRS
jgi:hypothetical protein